MNLDAEAWTGGRRVVGIIEEKAVCHHCKPLRYDRDSG